MDGATTTPAPPAQLFLASYDRERRALLRSLYDRAFTPEIAARIGWSSDEERADARLVELRRQVVTQQGYYDNPWERQYFINVRDRIAQTELYRVLQRMPKGAILHVHPTAMGDYAALVDAAAAYEAGGKRFFLAADSTGDPAQYFVLCDPASPPAGHLLLADTVGDPAARRRILGDLTVTDPELAGAGDVWKYFQPIFTRIHPLLTQAPLAAQYYTAAFRYLVETDHVLHVELRTSWRADNEATPGSKESIMLGALAAVNATGPRLTMKAIWSDSRHVSAPKKLADVQADMTYVAQAMKKAAVDGTQTPLAGYDLVGEEDTGDTSRYFLSQIAASLVAQEGRLLPTFYFHDGESDLPPSYWLSPSGGDDTPAQDEFNNNLADAYLLNTLRHDGAVASAGRVGHGLALFKTPALMARFREAGIAVELCPISNQLLRYLVDLREHPGQIYLAAGVPCALSPDDPAIYGYQGVTFDFWEACVAWNLDLKALKLLCYYSLQHSALAEAEKEERLGRWLDAWNEFVLWLNGHRKSHGGEDLDR